jgi:hypothetical protein
MHVTDVTPFEAVSVAISPTEPPLVDRDGVSSLVTLSVADCPVSDDASRSGGVGAGGAVASIVIGSEELVALRFPEESVVVALTLHAPGANAGNVHDVAESTT